EVGSRQSEVAVGSRPSQTSCLEPVRLIIRARPDRPTTRGTVTSRAQGWEGWDAYAPFYDWENARTVARRDVAFWQRLAAAHQGPVLELCCGTGRITLPVVRAGAQIVGIYRSAEMLARGRQRLRR